MKVPERNILSGGWGWETSFSNRMLFSPLVLAHRSASVTKCFMPAWCMMINWNSNKLSGSQTSFQVAFYTVVIHWITWWSVLTLNLTTSRYEGKSILADKTFMQAPGVIVSIILYQLLFEANSSADQLPPSACCWTGTCSFTWHEYRYRVYTLHRFSLSLLKVSLLNIPAVAQPKHFSFQSWVRVSYVGRSSVSYLRDQWGMQCLVQTT